MLFSAFSCYDNVVRSRNEKSVEQHRKEVNCMSLCGYRKLQADRTRSRWLIEITYRCTQWADQGIKQNRNWASAVFYNVAKYACLLFANLVNIFWILGTQLAWVTCRLVSPDKEKPDRIKQYLTEVRQKVES